MCKIFDIPSKELLVQECILCLEKMNDVSSLSIAHFTSNCSKISTHCFHTDCLRRVANKCPICNHTHLTNKKLKVNCQIIDITELSKEYDLQIYLTTKLK